MRSRGARALAVVLLLAVTVVGALAYVSQLARGEVVTAMRTLGAGGAAWGLYVVMDGFLLGAGVAVMACACIARFFRAREMEAVARISMPVALACFLAAALCVLADQGRPSFALAHLARYARPQSPLFATFTSVTAVCLLASLVHYVLARRPELAEHAKQPSFWQPLWRLLVAGYRGSPAQRRRRQQVGFWMSLALLPALAVPLAALAIIFTVRPGRPLSLVVGEAVTFTISSGALGLGVLAVAAALVRSHADLGARGFARLGRGLLLVDVLALLSVEAAQIAGLLSSAPAAAALARAQLGQPYAPLFWGEVGLFLLAGIMLGLAAWRKALRPGVVVVASLLTAVAVFLQRYLQLVAWQTHGLLLPYRPGSYVPSWIEIAVVLGILALSLLALLAAIRLVPFAPAAYDEAPVRGTALDFRRVLATALWFGAGLMLAALGFLSSLRIGTEPFLDPVLPASPVIFIAGLAVLATSGAIYELLPDRE